ncbi:MAG: peptide ABC transporter substrate-binding protein [Candidatus Humimicrobiaceae bacterium]
MRRWIRQFRVPCREMHSYESEGIQVIRQVWDGLVKYDPETLETQPAIADNWDISDDGLVYTFYLKKGVKFHSGDEVTAEDFIYAWTRAAAQETASYLAYHLAPIVGYDELQDGTADTFEGLKAIDDYTLEVTLKYPYADFINTLGHVVFYPVLESDIEEWGEEYAEHINGTGAFKFVEWVHDQYIVLEKNEDYYGDNAYLDSVRYLIMADENTAFLEFQAGNLEYTSIPVGQVNATQEDPEMGENVIIKPLLAIYYYGMNIDTEPFKDNPELREALSYIIDKENICEIVGEGVPTPATGFVPPGIPGFQENASEVSYNPEKAAELLEEAGYPDGEGLSTLKLGYNTGSSHEIIAEAIQADAAELGVDIEVEGYEWGTMLEKAQSGEINFFRLGWLADYPIMDNFLYPLFHSESADNYANYNNPEVDKLLEEARATLDEEERIAKYREVEKMILNDHAFALIYFYGSRRIIQPYVKGFYLSNMEDYDLSTVWLDK